MADKKLDAEASTISPEFPQSVPKRAPKPEVQIPPGTYCTKALAARKQVVAESCEWVKSGKGKNWEYKCCPVGEWRPKRKWVDKNGHAHIGKCSRAKLPLTLLMPKRENRRCLLGMRRKVIG